MEALLIQNLERDKREIECIPHEDVAAIQEYLDESDSDDSVVQNNAQRENGIGNDDLLVVTDNGIEVCNPEPEFELDPELSCEFSYTGDVSAFFVISHISNIGYEFIENYFSS